MNIQNFHESQFHAVEKKWPSKYNKNHKYQVVENGDGCVDVLSEVAMNNAYLICHNVQVNIQPNKNNLQLSHFDWRIWCTSEDFTGKVQRRRAKGKRRKDRPCQDPRYYLFAGCIITFSDKIYNPVGIPMIIVKPNNNLHSASVNLKSKIVNMKEC